MRLENETVWLTQKLIAELFQTTPQNITTHLKNIFEEGELQEDATCKDFLQVRIEGNREIKRNQKFYNLDAIISVGYRVKSHVATKFRIWAIDKANTEYDKFHEKRISEKAQLPSDFDKTIKQIEQKKKK